MTLPQTPAQAGKKIFERKGTKLVWSPFDNAAVGEGLLVRTKPGSLALLPDAGVTDLTIEPDPADLKRWTVRWKGDGQRRSATLTCSESGWLSLDGTPQHPGLKNYVDPFPLLLRRDGLIYELVLDNWQQAPKAR